MFGVHWKIGVLGCAALIFSWAPSVSNAQQDDVYRLRDLIEALAAPAAIDRVNAQVELIQHDGDIRVELKRAFKEGGPNLQAGILGVAAGRRDDSFLVSAARFLSSPDERLRYPAEDYLRTFDRPGLRTRVQGLSDPEEIAFQAFLLDHYRREVLKQMVQASYKSRGQYVGQFENLWRKTEDPEVLARLLTEVILLRPVILNGLYESVSEILRQSLDNVSLPAMNRHTLFQDGLAGIHEVFRMIEEPPSEESKDHARRVANRFPVLSYEPHWIRDAVKLLEQVRLTAAAALSDCSGQSDLNCSRFVDELRSEATGRMTVIARNPIFSRANPEQIVDLEVRIALSRLLSDSSWLDNRVLRLRNQISNMQRDYDRFHESRMEIHELKEMEVQARFQLVEVLFRSQQVESASEELGSFRLIAEKFRGQLQSDVFAAIWLKRAEWLRLEDLLEKVEFLIAQSHYLEAKVRVAEGKLGSALECLKRAYAAGFDDLEWFREDGDLLDLVLTQAFDDWYEANKK